MFELTLKDFRKLTHHLPENTVIYRPDCFGGLYPYEYFEGRQLVDTDGNIVLVAPDVQEQCE